MKKIYNSSGIEVKMAILGPIGIGYICPECGQPHCCRHHCLRCGQPLVFDEWQAEHYKEIYKDVDEECYLVDKQSLENGSKDSLTGEPLEPLTKILKELIKEWKRMETSS